ncbi:MAG: sulfatase, partial [Planctomycetaceae bacterium]|nr:sulfatase [Planctomycetaceae bacterium]
MHPPIPSPLDELGLSLTRRRFFARGSHMLGGAALATLLAEHGHGSTVTPPAAGVERVAGAIGPHFAPQAKHVIYL